MIDQWGRPDDGRGDLPNEDAPRGIAPEIPLGTCSRCGTTNVALSDYGTCLSCLAPRVDVPSAMTSRHSSETAEHYTPTEIVEYARATLGRIDLDPASCSEANETVKASWILTEEHNGYLADWRAAGEGQKELRVFLNPPGGWCDVDGRRVIKAKTVKSVTTPGCVVTGACGMAAPHTHVGTDSAQKRWWEKLAASWARGTVTDAFFVCFSIELLQSTQLDRKPCEGRLTPLPLEFPICFPSRRLAYRKPGGKIGASPPHASCLVCLSDDAAVLKRFYDLGQAFGHVTVPLHKSGCIVPERVQ